MAVSQKSSRPAGMHRTRTGAELPWYHLASPRPCRHGLACRDEPGLRAVTGAPGGGLAARRFTPTAQRPSSTPCSPARFHPSGFLSGAGGAYSPRQGCSLFAKGAHDPLVPIIIRKNSGFVNRGREQRNQKRWNSVNGKAQCLATPFRGSLSHFFFGTVLQLPHTCRSDSCAVLCRRVSYSTTHTGKIVNDRLLLCVITYLTVIKSASFSILSRFMFNEG